MTSPKEEVGIRHQESVIMPAARRKCPAANCEYETFENLNTQELVLRDLEIHVEITHKIPAMANYSRAQPPEGARAPATHQTHAATVLKPLPVPNYGEAMSLKDYIKRLMDWNEVTTAVPEAQKQQLVLESLSKNSYRKEEKDHLDASTAKLSEEKTVQQVITILNERFELSDDQEYDLYIKLMKETDSDSTTDLWNKTEHLMIKWEELKISSRPNFFFWRLKPPPCTTRFCALDP